METIGSAGDKQERGSPYYIFMTSLRTNSQLRPAAQVNKAEKEIVRQIMDPKQTHHQSTGKLPLPNRTKFVKIPKRE